MIRLLLITLFALVATVTSVSAFIPFLPLYPIIWTATAFLLLAELLLAGVLALILGYRAINNTPLTLSFLVFPVASLLLSLLLVPLSAYFTTYASLLLIHFIVLVLLTLLACCLSGVAARSQAETAQR